MITFIRFKADWKTRAAAAVALGVAGALGPAAWGETGRFELDPVPLANEAGRMASYADVLEPARQTVVSVTTARIVEIMRGQGMNPMEEFLRRFYGIPPQNRPQQPQRQGESTERRIPNGMGSGVIISPDGYILTNNHVVSDDAGNPVDEITINLSDGEQVSAVLVGRDARTDLALLKIERTGLPYIQMADSINLRVGDIVFAIGNPLGIGQTTTMGIVSATQRTNLGILGNQGYENFIQTDAAINRGNSGGALVDAAGRLVGINTAIVSQTGGNIGIGFAIPTRLIRPIILDLIDGGTVRRGFLGVSISNLNRDLAEAFGVDRARGALVETVQDGTPAARGGLRRGDIILRVGDEEIDNVSMLRLTVAGIRPGTSVPLAVWRNGEEVLLNVTLGSLDDPTAAASPLESPLNGVGLTPLTDALRTEWNTTEEHGLLVTEVNARSPFASVLSAGMVILEVNDQPVRTLADLDANLRRGAVNRVWISFRGNRGFVALRVER